MAERCTEKEQRPRTRYLAEMQALHPLVIAWMLDCWWYLPIPSPPNPQPSAILCWDPWASRHHEWVPCQIVWELFWCRHSDRDWPQYISNNPSFRLKHPGVPDGSDGSGGTSYPLTENQTRPVAPATDRVPHLPCGGYYTMPLIHATRRIVYYARRSGVRLPLLCVQNVVTYRHHRNHTYVTLFAGVAVMQ